MGSLHQGEEQSSEPRMLQAPRMMPAGCSTALAPSSLSPGGARQCFLPILPAGIRTPLQDKRLLCARELFNAAGQDFRQRSLKALCECFPDSNYNSSTHFSGQAVSRDACFLSPLLLQCSIHFTSFQQKKAERRESVCQRRSPGKTAKDQTPGNKEYAARKSDYLRNTVLIGISET